MNRELGLRFRARAASAFLFVVVAGCGGGNQPRNSAPEKESAPEKGNHQGSAPQKGPAFEGGTTTAISARDAARIVDLRTFPRMEGAEVQRENLSDVTYTAPGTMQQAADFCVKHLTEAGWREPPGERRSDKAGGREYQSFVFAKKGHILNVTLWPADTGVGVYIGNL